MSTYCPYTDREVSHDTTTSEHIIPLSLGGVNGFEIRVNANFNSKLGSELDGQLANDFFIAMRRTKYDSRGHSGKEPWATIKNARYGPDDRPAHVHIHRKHGIRIWDALDQEEKSGGGKIRFSTTLNVGLPVRFAAKVGLAAGYYAYGNKFRDCVDHHQLRQIMTIDPAKLQSDNDTIQAIAKKFKARVDSYLHETPSPSDWKLLALRNFCASVDGSTVVLVPGPNSFQVTVGILGQFIATINVPANTERFPNEGDYHWGHVMVSKDKTLSRASWFRTLSDTVDHVL
ncbi:MAG: hypothetical protein OXP75_05385 [Rhodospirillales bacterium]|nr:hypothetical protein [Rhodospirillales bacterium]